MNDFDLLERYNVLKFVITKYEITGNLESEWGTYDEIISEISILKATILDRMVRAIPNMDEVKHE